MNESRSSFLDEACIITVEAVSFTVEVNAAVAA